MPIQGHAIGRAGRTIKPMRQASAGPSTALSACTGPISAGYMAGQVLAGKAYRYAIQDSTGMTRPARSALPVERSGNRSGSRAVLTTTTNAGHVENTRKSEAEQGSWFR